MLSLEQLEQQFGATTSNPPASNPPASNPLQHGTDDLERLYAVSSERLRAWMIWIKGVCEITDEWQRYLRENINLSQRIIESSQKAAAVDKKPDDDTLPDETEEKNGNAHDTTFQEVEVIDDETADIVPPAMEIALEEAYVDESPETIEARIDKETDEEEEEMEAWPIATRYQQPLILPIKRKADQMETIRRLSLPKNEEEMIELEKNFTHQATLYRSYYKHWRQTADQAAKEMVGREVMATARIRGTVNGEAEGTTASQSAQYSMGQAESAVAQPMEEEKTQPAVSAAAAAPMSSVIDPSPTDAPERDAEALITVSDDQAEAVEPSADAGEEEEEEPLDRAEVPDVTAQAVWQAEPMAEPSTMETVSIPPSKTAAAPSARVLEKIEAASKLVKDKAQPSEDVSHFFYLKAEPDIEIAFEHNDEKVITLHTAREGISSKHEHLYFNLTDELEDE